MTMLRMVAFLIISLMFPTMSGCAGDTDRDHDTHGTAEEIHHSCQAPTTAGQLSQEKSVESQFRQVTTIRNKTQGVIANEPKVITAAVPNIYADGKKTGLSGIADGEPYRILDLQDGQDFEISGIPFRIAIFPDRDEVTVCQLTEAAGQSSTAPSP